MTTQYYYNGSLLMSVVEDGWMTMLFSYDASGQAVSVNYQGTEYYYVRNGQGDIVKIISYSSGTVTTVVEYAYDTWGRHVHDPANGWNNGIKGTLAGTVGYYQPFRYRGYVYDRESKFYYLQSRY